MPLSPAPTWGKSLHSHHLIIHLQDSPGRGLFIKIINSTKGFRQQSRNPQLTEERSFFSCLLRMTFRHYYFLINFDWRKTMSQLPTVSLTWKISPSVMDVTSKDKREEDLKLQSGGVNLFCCETIRQSQSGEREVEVVDEADKRLIFIQNWQQRSLLDWISRLHISPI